MSVADSLEDVRSQIASAAREAGRDPEDITLIAVSKKQPEERILAALDAGLTIFGENRVQEAQGRWPGLLPRHGPLELHLIGPLQTNKARDAVRLFDVIQTVDREKLAATLARVMEEEGIRRDCYVQVNTGEEPQKAGILPDDADAFIERCRETHGLPIVGLMCIPPIDEEPSPHFALLGEIARRNGLGGLSMGMSADYAVAVEMGATHVRVGSAIFGERPQA